MRQQAYLTRAHVVILGSKAELLERRTIASTALGTPTQVLAVYQFVFAVLEKMV